MLIYHPGTRTLYPESSCPYPLEQCRYPMVEDLSGALVVFGDRVVSLVCIPCPQGHTLTITGKPRTVEMLLPDATLRTAIQFAKEFNGEIITDQASHLDLKETADVKNSVD